MTEKIENRSDALQRIAVPTTAPQSDPKPRSSHALKQASRGVSDQSVSRPAGIGGGSGNEAAASIRRQLDEHGARVIELVYSDLLGRVDSLLVPAADYQRALAGVRVAADVSAGAGTVIALPDIRTLRFLPMTDTSGAMARFVCDLRSAEGEPAALCPRASLKRVADALHKAGLSARVTLSCRLPIEQPAGASLPHAFEPALAALAACRVPGLVIGFGEGKESAVASFGPQPLVDAADAVQLLREVISRALSRQGLRAPLAVSGINLALYRGKRNLFTDQAANRGAAAAFLSGTRCHAAGLTALLRPMWERGWAAAFGIRQLASDGCVAVSGLGGTGSPHLMLTGLIAAGLDGLRRAGSIDTQEPAGTVPECPPDPGLALAALMADECLGEAIGVPTVEAYAAALRERWERHWTSADR